VFNKGVKGRRPPQLPIRKDSYENKSSD